MNNNKCLACNSRRDGPNRFPRSGDSPTIFMLAHWFCDECLDVYYSSHGKIKPGTSVAEHLVEIRKLPGVEIRRAINILKGETYDTL